MVILKYVSMARLQFQAGQSEAGLGALRLGRKLGHKRHLPRLTITLAAEECVWLSRLGRHQEAIELAGQFGFDRSIYMLNLMLRRKKLREFLPGSCSKSSQNSRWRIWDLRSSRQQKRGCITVGLSFDSSGVCVIALRTNSPPGSD